MFTLIFIKYLGLPKKIRLIVGFLALAFLIVIGFRLFFYDPIARWRTAEEIVYVNFRNNPKGNHYQSMVIDLILKKFALNNLDRKLISGDFAISCDKNNCFLLIQTDNLKNLIGELQKEKLTWQKVRRDIIIISENNQQPRLKKIFNPWAYQQRQNQLTRSSFKAVIYNNNEPTDDWQKIVNYFNQRIIRGRISNWGIEITNKNKQIQPTDDNLWNNQEIIIQKKSSNKPVMINGDYNNPQETSIFNLLEELTNNNFYFQAKKIKNTGILLNDYDFLIKLPQPIDKKSLNNIENAWLNWSKELSTKEKNLYLNDGTKVITLIKNQDLLWSNDPDTDSRKIITINENNRLFLITDKDYLTITNNTAYLQQNHQSEESFGIIALSQLNDNNPLKRILRDFSWIYFNNSGVLIK